MNKQRLMELAGVQCVSEGRTQYVVVTMNDGYFGVEGPFASQKQAEQYRLMWAAENGTEGDESGQVAEINPPVNP